jgi:hypothetical protein
MHKTATIVAVGTLAIGVTLVGANVATAGSDDNHAVSIHIIDTDQQIALQDFNHNGPDFGDIVAFRSIDTDPQGKAVGHGIGQLTLLGAHDNSLTVTLVLAAGDITMQGDITGLQTGARSRIAVTGGTGRYAGARGFADTRQIGDGVTDLVIHVNP